MQPGEALGVAAQVAVTLAGFAGIVVVFRPESVHHWSALDQLRLRLLLYNSAFPLSYSLFGLFLLSVDTPIVAIWRWCSGFVLALALFSMITFRRDPSAPLPLIKARRNVLFYGMFAVGIISLLLQAVNIVYWNKFWPFFFAIVFHLMAAMLQFLRIVLLPPYSSSPR